MRLRGFLDGLKPGLAGKFADHFDKQSPSIRRDSYIISLSEHSNQAGGENQFGRLSMWRAYGGDINLALILNHINMLPEQAADNVFISPVLYTEESQFKVEFYKIVDGVEKYRILLRQCGADWVRGCLINAFNMAALLTKHPGFAEEREWRAIISPRIHPTKTVESHIGTIGGVPQRVYKLKFRDGASPGSVDFSLGDLLDEIIIGPTRDPAPIYDALFQLLEDAGIQDAGDKVRVSGIPLRK